MDFNGENDAMCPNGELTDVRRCLKRLYATKLPQYCDSCGDSISDVVLINLSWEFVARWSPGSRLFSGRAETKNCRLKGKATGHRKSSPIPCARPSIESGWLEVISSIVASRSTPPKMTAAILNGPPADPQSAVNSSWFWSLCRVVNWRVSAPSDSARFLVSGLKSVGGVATADSDVTSATGFPPSYRSANRHGVRLKVSLPGCTLRPCFIPPPPRMNSQRIGSSTDEDMLLCHETSSFRAAGASRLKCTSIYQLRCRRNARVTVRFASPDQLPPLSLVHGVAL